MGGSKNIYIYTYIYIIYIYIVCVCVLLGLPSPIRLLLTGMPGTADHDSVSARAPYDKCPVS